MTAFNLHMKYQCVTQYFICKGDGLFSTWFPISFLAFEIFLNSFFSVFVEDPGFHFGDLQIIGQNPLTKQHEISHNCSSKLSRNEGRKYGRLKQTKSKDFTDLSNEMM